MDKFDAPELSLPLPEMDEAELITPISMRALVAPKEAGVIIGRGGTHVAALRKKTGVKAGVSKVVPRVHRVLTLTGPLESVAHAFYIIAQSFLDNAKEEALAPDLSPSLESTDAASQAPGSVPTNASTPASSPASEEGPGTTTLRILLSHTLMGAVIGKQGAAIKAIQEASGTRMVASKEMLPNSTERVVDVTGTPSGIQQAITDVGRCVAMDHERQGIVLYEPDPSDGPAPLSIGVPFSASSPSFRLRPLLPKCDYPFASLPMLNLDLYSGQRYTAHIASLQHQRVFSPTGIPAGSATSPAAIATAAAQGAAVAPGGGFVAGGITGVGPATAPAVVDAANMRTQNISIPADMVGCIIGKAGSKITEIRRLSGSRISIAKVSHDATGERLFTIQGTPASNEKALYLLYNQLETEKERRQQAAPQEEDSAS